MKVDEYHLKLYIFGFLFGVGFTLLVWGYAFWGIFKDVSTLLLIIMGVIWLMLGLLGPFLERENKKELNRNE